MDENLTAWVRFAMFTAQMNASVPLGPTTTLLPNLSSDPCLSTNLTNWSSIEGQTKMIKKKTTANSVMVNLDVDVFSDSARWLERDLLLPLLTLAPIPLPPRWTTAFDDLW